MKYTNITYNENGIEFIRTIRPTEKKHEVIHELLCISGVFLTSIIKVDYYVVK